MQEGLAAAIEGCQFSRGSRTGSGMKPVDMTIFPQVVMISVAGESVICLRQLGSDEQTREVCCTGTRDLKQCQGNHQNNPAQGRQFVR